MSFEKNTAGERYKLHFGEITCIPTLSKSLPLERGDTFLVPAHSHEWKKADGYPRWLAGPEWSTSATDEIHNVFPNSAARWISRSSAEPVPTGRFKGGGGEKMLNTNPNWKITAKLAYSTHCP